jgi:hypothetical protein
MRLAAGRNAVTKWPRHSYGTQVHAAVNLSVENKSAPLADPWGVSRDGRGARPGGLGVDRCAGDQPGFRGGRR